MNANESRRALAKISENQRGLVTTQQAELAGVPRIYLSRMDKAGDLERVIQGVYRVVGAPDDQYTDIYAHWLALDPARTAAERFGDSSQIVAVSHRSAAEIYSIGDLPEKEYSFTTSFRKQTTRTMLHLTQARIGRSDVRIMHGMHVTTPSRTIADMYKDEPDESHVSDVLGDAIESGLTTRDAVASYLGMETTEGLLVYRGLDSQTLASQLLNLDGLSPVIASALDRTANSFSALLEESVVSKLELRATSIDYFDDFRAMTTSAVENALVNLLAQSDWSALLRASRNPRPAMGVLHA